MDVPTFELGFVLSCHVIVLIQHQCQWMNLVSDEAVTIGRDFFFFSFNFGHE